MDVIVYKGMNSNMSCRGFQYEIGKTYKTDKVKLCECGFHACLNPRDVLDYYPHYRASRYFNVKLSGDIAKCGNFDTKVAATEITILEEINIDEIIGTTEWWKNDNVLDLLPWSEGFAKFQRGDGSWNFLDKQGNILSNKWFYCVADFDDGFAIVQRSDTYLWNFIDKNGNYLSNEWFNYLGSFYEGFAIVQRSDSLCNFIDKQGNILSDEWFKWVDNFYEGFAKVQRGDNLYNCIDKQGNYLFKEWFNWVDDFQEGFARVQRANGEWAKIDKSGKLIKILQ
mgnify:FL=1